MSEQAREDLVRAGLDPEGYLGIYGDCIVFGGYSQVPSSSNVTVCNIEFNFLHGFLIIYHEGTFYRGSQILDVYEMGYLTSEDIIDIAKKYREAWTW